VLKEEHALRVSKVRGRAWLFLHLPLLASILLTSVLIEADRGADHAGQLSRMLVALFLWLYIVCTSCLGALHKQERDGTPHRWSKGVRIVVRIALGALLFGAAYLPLIFEYWVLSEAVICLIVTAFDWYGRRSRTSSSVSGDELEVGPLIESGDDTHEH
jgi:hypothetical protein